MKDRRWLNRQKVWDIAERSLNNLKNNDTPFMGEQIVETAKTRGFLSVWMTVFAEDTDMLKRFIYSFEGTCQSCFNDQFQPIPRPGGAL